MSNNCFFLRFHQDKSNTLTKDQNKLSFNYFGCRFFGKKVWKIGVQSKSDLIDAFAYEVFAVVPYL